MHTPSLPSLKDRRVLVTGVTGFVGGYLAEALLEREARVFGFARSDWPDSCAHLRDQVTFREGDLCEGNLAEEIIRQAEPEWIFHLAGYANAGQSFHEPEAAWEGNLTATRILYEAVSRWGGQPRIVFVGSGHVYGDVSSTGQQLHEELALKPTSPYAASKAAADLLSYQCSCAPGLDIVRARPFNHIGPRQSPQYAVANFARQIAAIERGEQEPVLHTGNLSPQRDLTDVRDVVAAYLLLAQWGQKGEAYNVASGDVYSMQTVLDHLIGLSSANVEVRPREDLVRQVDLSVVRVDTSRIRQQTGWTSRISLTQTLYDTLTYWRELRTPPAQS